MIRSALCRISARRLEETWLDRYRCQRFLLAHPYCQVWLAEHRIAEEIVICQRGRVLLDGAIVCAPLSTEIHHRNKGRGVDLLDPRGWLAVSSDAHRRIEANKTWARARRYLEAF